VPYRSRTGAISIRAGCLPAGAVMAGLGQEQKPSLLRPGVRSRLGKRTFPGGAADLSNAPKAEICPAFGSDY
jgi:hypothetical protein